MEMSEQYFLEELLALRRDMNWELAMPTEMSDLISSTSGWNFDTSDQTNESFLPESGYVPMDQQNFGYMFSEPVGHHPLASDSISYGSLETATSNFEAYNGGYPITSMEEEELGILEDEIHNLEVQASCKLEPVQSPEIPVFNTASCDFRRKINSSKKSQGQPSKNLMAERRRRKRLNERLTMLRSIVPKISKMDRTAILADAIDYVKELLEKIGHLQRGMEEGNPSMGILRDGKPNEYLVRNSPKFNVERRDNDTRIEICCAAKPGLLLSTVHTLEALGLDIQQCVISCFNDFAVQASCSQEMENGRALGPDEIKQALFETAGYGGRCL